MRRDQFWVKPDRPCGWIGWLSTLWAGMGAYLSGLTFLFSTQPVTLYGEGIPPWLGGPGKAHVNWRELAICVAFVAVGAVMTALLSRPEAIARLLPAQDRRGTLHSRG
jgi:hypothetical protein